ncbi:hypothetical protein ACP70R_044645 [Stipagrostis hirtigluma subsp. patula]
MWTVGLGDPYLPSFRTGAFIKALSSPETAMSTANGDAARPSSSQDGSTATMKKRNRPQYCKISLKAIAISTFAKACRLEEKLLNHPFTQQQLPACKPILTPQMVIPVLVFVGIIFIPIGLACIAASNKVVEVVDQYETKCVPQYLLRDKVAYIQDPSIDKTCTRILKIPKDMKKPIYVYYQLDKFYQNHRRYMKSRSDMQLRNPKKVDDTRLCKPEATVHGNPIVPCGLIAWSLFNDTYSFARGDKMLMVNKQGISWRSEREHIFGKHVYPRNFQNGSLIGGGSLDPTKPLSKQEDLIVWMRTAALPTFRKLYGKIEVDLQANELITVTMQNNYNTYSFGGKKTLVLSTAGVLGGKNSFLGRAYVIVGMACLLLALLLTLLYLVFPLREQDISLRTPPSRLAR